MQFGNNFDDISDIYTPGCFAFGQRDPRTVFAMGGDGSPIPPGTELTFYSFPELELLGSAHVKHTEVMTAMTDAEYLQHYPVLPKSSTQ